MKLTDWYIVIMPSVPCSGRKRASEKMSADSIQHQPPQLTLKLSLEQIRQAQLSSTFRTCWVSTGTRKYISLTELVTLSQYIRETLFYCRCFLIFRNKLLNFNFSEPQNSFFKTMLPMFFLNFFNHKLPPFRRWSMNVVNCFEIF